MIVGRAALRDRDALAAQLGHGADRRVLRHQDGRAERIGLQRADHGDLAAAGRGEYWRRVADSADVDRPGAHRLEHRRTGGEVAPVRLERQLADQAGGGKQRLRARAGLVADVQRDVGDVDRAGRRGAAAPLERCRWLPSRSPTTSTLPRRRAATAAVTAPAPMRRPCHAAAAPDAAATGHGHVPHIFPSLSTPSSASRRVLSAVSATWFRSRGLVRADLAAVADPAGGEHQDAVGERERLVDVMRDQQHRGPVVVPQAEHEPVHGDPWSARRER